MVVSLRTLINTTFFWALLFIGFRLYTKYDATPAKEFLHFIGWDKLGNITVTYETPEQQIQSLSDQLIVERLNNIEQICAKSVRLYMYDQPPVPNYTTVTVPTPNNNFLSNTSSATTTTGTIRVIENTLLRGSGTLQP